MKNRVFYVFFIFEKSKIGFYLNNDLFGNDFSGGVFKNDVFLPFSLDGEKASF